MQVDCLVPEAEALFQNKRDAFVHSVYHRVFNVQYQNRLFVFHSGAISMTPFSISLKQGLIENLELEEGMLVWFSKEGMILENQKILIQNRKIWDPRLKEKLSYFQRKNLYRKVLQCLKKKRHREGLSDYAVTGNTKGNGLVESMLRKQVENLQTAKYFGAHTFAREAGTLIGLGIGLTPSGDDFLVGLLLAFQISDKDGSNWQQDLIEEIKKRVFCTNDISRQFLICACRGAFSQRIHEMIQVCAQEKQLESKIKAVAETGHSSGVDILNGLAIGLQITEFIENRRERDELFK